MSKTDQVILAETADYDIQLIEPKSEVQVTVSEALVAMNAAREDERDRISDEVKKLFINLT